MRTFILPMAIPPGEVITLNRRAHWAAVHRQTVQLRMRGAAMLRMQPHRPRLKRAHCTVHVAYPDRRRRDVHNLMGTVKPVLDGLVDARLLPDDDDAHLSGPDLRVWVPGANPDIDGAMAQAGHPTWLRLVWVFREGA